MPLSPISYPFTCSSFELMITVMGPCVATYPAIAGDGECHQALPAQGLLLSTHRCPSSLPTPSVCLCPVPFVSLPPSTHVPHSGRTVFIAGQHDEVVDPGHLRVIWCQAPVDVGMPPEWVVFFTGQTTWRQGRRLSSWMTPPLQLSKAGYSL